MKRSFEKALTEVWQPTLTKGQTIHECLADGTCKENPEASGYSCGHAHSLARGRERAIGFRQVMEGIDAPRETFPQLAGVDAIWVVKTIVWKTAGDVWFFHLWPGGVRRPFSIQTQVRRFFSR